MATLGVVVGASRKLLDGLSDSFFKNKCNLSAILDESVHVLFPIMRGLLIILSRTI